MNSKEKKEFKLKFQNLKTEKINEKLQWKFKIYNFYKKAILQNSNITIMFRNVVEFLYFIGKFIGTDVNKASRLLDLFRSYFEKIIKSLVYINFIFNPITLPVE